MSQMPATSFGVLLGHYRLDVGLSQAHLAEVAGLSLNAISSLERGTRRHPHPDTVARLVAALGHHGLSPPSDLTHL